MDSAILNCYIGILLDVMRFTKSFLMKGDNYKAFINFILDKWSKDILKIEGGIFGIFVEYCICIHYNDKVLIHVLLIEVRDVVIKRQLYLILLILLLVIIVIIFFQSFLVSKQSDDELKLESQVTSWGYDLLISDIFLEHNEKVKIAIIDSGINKDHEDLQHIKFTEFNVLDKETAIIDEFGHGTAIAGIIAAENNEFGVVGLSLNVEIYDVKILNENGKGEIEHLIEAIDWCIEQNVEIINLSFGFQTESKPLKEAIDRAISEGIIIVASVGNTFGMRGDYPAIYEDVISITSVDEDLNRSSFASKHDIDYAMPGENIYTTNKDGSYSFFNGTSFATAHATGIISILLEYYEQEQSEFKKNTSFEDYLKQHSFSKNDWEFSDYGNGILKLRKED